MAADIMNDRIPVVNEDFAMGYEEMVAVIKADPEVASMTGRAALRHVGLLSSDFVYDNYVLWDPVVDSVTASCFGGNYGKFYSFRDGAELAVQTLMDSEFRI